MTSIILCHFKRLGNVFVYSLHQLDNNNNNNNNKEKNKKPKIVAAKWTEIYTLTALLIIYATFFCEVLFAFIRRTLHLVDFICSYCFFFVLLPCSAFFHFISADIRAVSKRKYFNLHNTTSQHNSFKKIMKTTSISKRERQQDAYQLICSIFEGIIFVPVPLISNGK